MVVFLTLLTISRRAITFNLAFGLLGGAVLQGAFSLACGTRRLGTRGLRGRGAHGPVSGTCRGCGSGCINHRALDWDYFWATSRVVKDTINEYPFWSLVFADLHAHVFAIPVLLLFLAPRSPA